MFHQQNDFPPATTSKRTHHQQTDVPPADLDALPRAGAQTPLATVGGFRRENKQALAALCRRRIFFIMQSAIAQVEHKLKGGCTHTAPGPCFGGGWACRSIARSAPLSRAPAASNTHTTGIAMPRPAKRGPRRAAGRTSRAPGTRARAAGAPSRPKAGPPAYPPAHPQPKARPSPAGWGP